MFLLKIISKQRFFSHLIKVLDIILWFHFQLYLILLQFYVYGCYIRPYCIIFLYVICFINEETIPQSNITMITYKELGYRQQLYENVILTKLWDRTGRGHSNLVENTIVTIIKEKLANRLLQNYYYKCIIRNNIDIVPKNCITIETNIAKKSRISYYQWNNDAEK